MASLGDPRKRKEEQGRGLSGERQVVVKGTLSSRLCSQCRAHTPSRPPLPSAPDTTATLSHCLRAARMGWVHESPRGGGRGSRGAAGGRQCAAPLGARGRTSLCSRMSFVHIKYKDSVGLGMEIVEAKEQPRLSREDVWGGEGWRSNEVPTPWAANQSFGGRQWGGAAESLLLPPEVSQSQLLKKKKKKKERTQIPQSLCQVCFLSGS